MFCGVEGYAGIKIEENMNNNDPSSNTRSSYWEEKSISVPQMSLMKRLKNEIYSFPAARVVCGTDAMQIDDDFSLGMASSFANSEITGVTSNTAMDLLKLPSSMCNVLGTFFDSSTNSLENDSSTVAIRNSSSSSSAMTANAIGEVESLIEATNDETQVAGEKSKKSKVLNGSSNPIELEEEKYACSSIDSRHDEPAAVEFHQSLDLDVENDKVLAAGEKVESARSLMGNKSLEEQEEKHECSSIDSRQDEGPNAFSEPSRFVSNKSKKNKGRRKNPRREETTLSQLISDLLLL